MGHDQAAIGAQDDADAGEDWDAECLAEQQAMAMPDWHDDILAEDQAQAILPIEHTIQDHPMADPIPVEVLFAPAIEAPLLEPPEAIEPALPVDNPPETEPLAPQNDLATVNLALLDIVQQIQVLIAPVAALSANQWTYAFTPIWPTPPKR